MKKLQAECIIWVDSSRLGATVWVDRESLQEQGKLLDVLSIGWVLKETDESILLAGHVAPDCVSGHLLIPKVAIRKRIKVKGLP